MIDAPHWEAIHPIFKRHQQQLRLNLAIDRKINFVHIEMNPLHFQSLKMKTKIVLIMMPLLVKILMIEMSTKRGLSKVTLIGVLMTMKLIPILMLMIWLNVMNMMQMLLLEFSMLQIRPVFMNLLPHHFMQIFGKIWLILKLFSKHLLLLGKRT